MTTTTNRFSNLFAGPFETREEILSALKSDPEVWIEFQRMGVNLQEDFLSFCLGKRGLNITYDPVFKKVFDPESHPERLEEFLSLCLGEKLQILKVMSNESTRLTEDGSLLVMDILVKLVSGALVNVEIQRIGYRFPGARAACYSSDLVMRQYLQVKNEYRGASQYFTYREIKKVYTIVLIQESTSEFKRFPNEFLHYSKQKFNTGLDVDLLQEYLMIPLDIFRKCCENTGIRSKLEAWLFFISTDRREDIERLLEAYPEFEALYQEVFAFRYHVKELVGVYSKVLSEFDANTVKLMIDEYKEEYERVKGEYEQIQGEFERVQGKLERMQGNLERVQGDYERVQGDYEQMQGDYEQMQGDYEQMQGDYEQMRKENAQMQEELLRLRALLSNKPVGD